MKTLTLQITGDSFRKILSGEQKIESREIRPKSAKRYVEINADGDAVDLILFDELYLINGRQPNSPRLNVNVESTELVYLEDEDGEIIKFKENGEEYLLCRVEYTLGQITNKINC